MTTPDAVIKFSLGLEQLSFELDGQHFQIDKGLRFIQSNSMRHGVLDELAIELMIYVIEEILESVLRVGSNSLWSAQKCNQC